jgi:predicted transcriptional regulator
LSTEVEHEKEKDRIDWRRSKVQELSSQGHSQRDIAQILQVSNGTVNKDLSILRQQAKENIKKYIDEWLPEEYEKCMVGLTAITKEAWNTSQQTEDKREKIQALSLAKDCYSMKLDLLTNVTVIDDAIRFVSSSNYQKEEGQQRQQQISSEKQEEEKAKANGIVIESQDSSGDDIQGSEKEDKQQQQQHTRDITPTTTSTTTNQTF